LKRLKARAFRARQVRLRGEPWRVNILPGVGMWKWRKKLAKFQKVLGVGARLLLPDDITWMARQLREVNDTNNANNANNANDDD
jgi:hypothetical protein